MRFVVFCRSALTVSMLSDVYAQINPATLNGLEWRGIGPAATGGRIADLAVVKSPGQADIIYVATSTGVSSKASTREFRSRRFSITPAR